MGEREGGREKKRGREGLFLETDAQKTRFLVVFHGWARSTCPLDTERTRKRDCQREYVQFEDSPKQRIFTARTQFS